MRKLEATMPLASPECTPSLSTLTRRLPETIPRSEVVDELYDAVVLGRPPLHSGEWGLATLEICLAILASAESGRQVELQHQDADAVATAFLQQHNYFS